MNQRRRRRNESNALLLLVVFAAAFCLIDEKSPTASFGAASLDQWNGLIVTIDDVENDNDREDENNGHRALMSITPPSEAMERVDPDYVQRAPLHSLEEIVIDYDYDAAFDAAYRSSAETLVKQPMQPIAPYTIENAVREAGVFTSSFALLVYNPAEDNFVGLYPTDWTAPASSEKLFVTLSILSTLLRKLFPERFNPEQPELALAIGSVDYPHVDLSKLPYTSGAAPLLQFSSAFRDTTLYPNMIPMPMPERHHLHCFLIWVETGNVCKQVRTYREGGGRGEMVFGKEGLEFDKLIVS